MPSPRNRRVVERGAVLGDVQSAARRSVRAPSEEYRSGPAEALPSRSRCRWRRVAHLRGSADQDRWVVPRDAPRVVVDAEEVDPLPSASRSHGGNSGHASPNISGISSGYAAQEDRVEILPVHVGIGATSPRHRRALVGGGILRLEVDDEPDLVPRPRRDRPPRAARVRAQEVVRRDGRFVQVAMSGREHAVQVAAVHDDPRLVQRRPHRHAIVERAEDHPRVVGEPFARCRD